MNELKKKTQISASYERLTSGKDTLTETRNQKKKFHTKWIPEGGIASYICIRQNRL